MLPLIGFNLFGHAISIVSYYLFALLASIAGVLSAFWMLKREQLPTGNIIVLLSAIYISFFTGARLLNYLINRNAFGDNFFVWSVKMAKFSLYGGILGATIVVLFLIYFLKLDLWKILDALVVPFAVSFTLMSIGCFMNGCCAGKLTLSCWGVHFPSAAMAEEQLAGFSNIFALASPGLHPTQLYELLFALVGLLPVIWIYRKKLIAGTAFLCYGIWFSAMRWIVLYFRDYPYDAFIIDIVYPMLYFTIICICLILLVKRNSGMQKY